MEQLCQYALMRSTTVRKDSLSWLPEADMTTWMNVDAEAAKFTTNFTTAMGKVITEGEPKKALKQIRVIEAVLTKEEHFPAKGILNCGTFVHLLEQTLWCKFRHLVENGPGDNITKYFTVLDKLKNVSQDAGFQDLVQDLVQDLDKERNRMVGEMQEKKKELERVKKKAADAARDLKKMQDEFDSNVAEIRREEQNRHENLMEDMRQDIINAEMTARETVKESNKGEKARLKELNGKISKLKKNKVEQPGFFKAFVTETIPGAAKGVLPNIAKALWR